jgi:hypothetical protein
MLRKAASASSFIAFAALSLSAFAQEASIPRLEDVPEPARASLASIEAGALAPAPGAAFAIHRWDLVPKVIVLDMADFAEQDRMFSRLAFFLEKPGFRGRLLTDAELAGKHGWNAHDYGPDGLASFFTKAAAARFPLDPEELLLRALALREGLISREGAAFVPGSGAVLSLSRSSSKYERILLLAHESYHGVYFCSEEYRNLCARLWSEAPASERRFMTRLLEALGYDVSDPGLVVNEFQAYLLQQPRSMAAAYFERVGKLFAGEEGIPSPTEVLPFLLKDEKLLDAFASSRYGIEAGGAYVKGGAGE